MTKNPYQQMSTMMGGWTRIDMLLAIYDRGIAAVRGAEQAHQDQDANRQAVQTLEAQKCILAIHAGLKPDEHEIAFNIARLLNFVLRCLEEQRFSDATKILEQLRSGFEAIHDEAVKLEQEGVVPPLDVQPEFDTVA